MKNSLIRSRITYACIFVFALIFTQALRTPLSTMLFWFVTLLPVVTLIYAALTLASVRCHAVCDNRRIIRGERARISCLITNASILPLFYIEAHVVYPDENLVANKKSTRELTLLPLGSASASEEITFLYRGRFDIGFESVVVYDLLKLFRLKSRVYSHVEIEVCPQTGALDIFELQTKPLSGESMGQSPSHTDRTELFALRDYASGDSLKNIHWKLSSKRSSDEFNPTVKIYSNDDLRRRYILCNLEISDEVLYAPVTEENESSDIPSETELHSLGDAVVEAALACAYSGVRAAMPCFVVWYDIMLQKVITCEINEHKDFISLYNTIAFSRAYRSHEVSFDFVSLIKKLLSYPEPCELYPVISYLDGEMFKSFCSAESTKNAVYPILISGKYSKLEREKRMLLESGISSISVPADRPFLTYETISTEL